MYIILCYDVNIKQISRVRKTCLKYLQFTQKSAYEGEISIVKLSKLKRELKNVIDQETDEIVIFKMESVRFSIKERIGKAQVLDFIL